VWCNCVYRSRGTSYGCICHVHNDIGVVMYVNSAIMVLVGEMLHDSGQ